MRGSTTAAYAALALSDRERRPESHRPVRSRRGRRLPRLGHARERLLVRRLGALRPRRLQRRLGRQRRHRHADRSRPPHGDHEHRRRLHQRRSRRGARSERRDQRRPARGDRELRLRGHRATPITTTASWSARCGRTWTATTATTRARASPASTSCRASVPTSPSRALRAATRSRCPRRSHAGPVAVSFSRRRRRLRTRSCSTSARTSELVDYVVTDASVVPEPNAATTGTIAAARAAGASQRRSVRGVSACAPRPVSSSASSTAPAPRSR